jgi:RNA polymerase sigma-70 factor, ECF subfamily
MPIQDDKQELDGLQQFDPQVISEIYDRYFPYVFGYVRYRLSDIVQAEDITSDVFMRLLEAVRKGKGPDSNIKAWLISTASHAVNDHHRRTYRRPTEEINEMTPDLQATPSESTEQLERTQRIREAMTKLTPDQQHVIALRFGQELSLDETAKIMKKKANAVKQLQFRALAALIRQVDELL